MINWGDKLDRFTINFIKKNKKAGVEASPTRIIFLLEELFNLNLTLWTLEDEIRSNIPDEQAGKIGKEIARVNDKRAQVKNTINELLGSSEREEKIYNK
jgi:hypothetical protein